MMTCRLPENVRAALHGPRSGLTDHPDKMGIQLKVHGPKGEEKIVDLCDSDRELRKITVTQLMDKLSHEPNMTEEIRIRSYPEASAGDQRQ